MTNPVTPRPDPPGLVEEEGVQSTAADADQADAGSAAVDPETGEEPAGDALLGPADGAGPGQELAGEG